MNCSKLQQANGDGGSSTSESSLSSGYGSQNTVRIPDAEQQQQGGTNGQLQQGPPPTQQQFQGQHQNDGELKGFDDLNVYFCKLKK